MEVMAVFHPRIAVGPTAVEGYDVLCPQYQQGGVADGHALTAPLPEGSEKGASL